MKKHSKKMDIASLLKNKNVLYVVLFFTVMNLFSYLMLKQLDAVAFFVIIGFLTTYFSKNMIVVLLSSMVSTFLLVQIKLLGNVQEGLDATDTPPTTTPEVQSEQTSAVAPAVTPTATPPVTSAAPPDAVSGTAPVANRGEVIKPKKDDSAATATNAPPPERFTQKLSPARYSASDDDDMPRHKPKVDYASTLESAYDNLDKMLSSDAIRSMTEDTGRLAEKQKMLMGNIEKMAPIMEKAGSILQSFDMSAITKLMDSIGSNASKLKSGIKPIADIETQ